MKLLTSLALLSLGAFASAQTGEEPKQQPATRTIPTSMRLTRTKADLSVPVTGLTADNAAKVKTALEGLNTHVYSCAACSERYAMAGNCPGCLAGLKDESKPIFSQVTVTPDQGLIKFQTHEGIPVRYSDIDRALKANSITVDSSKLQIGGQQLAIFVSGATTDEHAKAIQTSLEEAKLFQRVNTTIDPATKNARISVVSSATPPTRAAIDSALAKAGANYKITDVVWNAPGDEAEKK